MASIKAILPKSPPRLLGLNPKVYYLLRHQHQPMSIFVLITILSVTCTRTLIALPALLAYSLTISLISLRITCSSNQKNPKRKRKTHPTSQTLSKHSPKHQQLIEFSGNNVIAEPIEQSPEHGRQSSKQGPPPATPTRQGRIKKTAPRPDPVFNHLGYIKEANPDQRLTPRPNPLKKIPSFPQSFQSRPANPQSQPPLSHRASSDSGESRGSNKAISQSPTKTLRDLQFSDIPIDSQTWSSGTIPTDLKELARDIQVISRGAGIIPIALKDKFAETQEIILDFQRMIESEKQRGKELR